MSKLVVAFSGGKDSTAMALQMAELGEEFELFFTPTGNELAGLVEHVKKIARWCAAPLRTPDNKPLAFWINEFNALPNWRQRWCTRLIKIEPCVAYLKTLDDPVLCVGLRADEEERRGLYGDWARYRYPLREWGWGIDEVWKFLKDNRVSLPRRTDCAVCPYQRLGEWYELWRDHPDEYQQGVDWEEKTGFTFRSPQRDTWPAALKDLRAEFESGRKPRGVREEDAEDELDACRVCKF